MLGHSFHMRIADYTHVLTLTAILALDSSDASLAGGLPPKCLLALVHPKQTLQGYGPHSRICRVAVVWRVGGSVRSAQLPQGLICIDWGPLGNHCGPRCNGS